MRYVIFWLCFLGFSGSYVGILAAEDAARKYPEPPGKATRMYVYYNTKTGESPGRAVYYSAYPGDGYAEYVLILYRNRKNEVYAFIEMNIDSAGKLLRAHMEEFNDKYTVGLELDGNRYNITLEENGKTDRYQKDAENYIILPMLERYLLANIETILKNKKTEFVLFFPNLLNKSFRLSYFDFIAEITERRGEHQWNIEVYPDSFLIRNLLPADKQKITVVYDEQIQDISNVFFSDEEFRLTPPE